MAPAVKALLFDVFGTLVDFRTSIVREAQETLKPLGYTLDWAAFADAWRSEYQPALEDVRTGRAPYCKLDVLHQRNLQATLKRFNVDSLSEELLRQLNLAWHRCDAWPDVPSALARLKRTHLLAALSNGNISLMVDIARRNNFPWDAILGADIARDFKPKPRVYLAAAEAFDIAPQNCMLVASHSYDLKAAAALGFHTAHVARPNEDGPGRGENAPSVPVDIAVNNLVELADTLAAAAGH
jgi:2-haloacid dehalogenase